MKVSIITLALLLGAQSHAATVTGVTGKCEAKVTKAAEKAIAEEGASDIFEIAAVDDEKNLFTASYLFPECIGSVTVKIQPITTKVEKGVIIATDCKVLSAEDSQDPNCG